MKFIKPAYLLAFCCPSLFFYASLGFRRVVFKKLCLLVIMACPLFVVVAETRESKINCNTKAPEVKCTIRISEEDRAEMSDLIIGMNLNFPSELRLLKDDSIDFSEFVREIKKTANSDYDNGWTLWEIEALLIQGYVFDLCDKSKNPEECTDRVWYSELNSTIREIENNKKERILYPQDYLPVGNLKENQFLKAFQSLDTPCLGKCSNEDLAQAIRSSSPKQYKTLFPKIKEQDQDCLRDLLENLRDLLENENFPKACLKEENKTHVVCRNMLESLNITKKRLGDLMAMAYDPSVLTEAGAFCTDCLNYEKETELSQLQNSLKNLTRLNPCLELGPGEEKRIKTDIWGNAADYILKRDTEGNYNIDFPVEFYADEDYDGDIPLEAVPNTYRKRVQECLKEANTMMLGPKGEKINLSISKIPECSTQRQSRPTRIAIGSKHDRSYAKKYEADIDCSAITHEILHLAGLCDEYEEFSYALKTTETGESIPTAKMGIKLQYDCRLVVENSIMGNSWHKWEYSKENNESLLLPGHFNSLLYGSCVSKNPAYECSALAYQSSFDDDSCLDKKAQCEKSNALGQDKQKLIKFIEYILSLNEDLYKSIRATTKKLEQNRRDLTPSEKQAIEINQFSLEMIKIRQQGLKERLEIIRSWPDE